MQAGCSLRFTVTSSMADCRSRIAIYRLSSETLTSTSNGSLAVRDRKHHTSQRKQIQARQGRKRAVLPSSWTAPRLKSSELHEYGFFCHHTKSGQAHWTFFTLWAEPRTRFYKRLSQDLLRRPSGIVVSASGDSLQWNLERSQ